MQGQKLTTCDASEPPKVRLPKLTDSSGGPSLSENVRSFFQTCQFFDVCLVVKAWGGLGGWLVCWYVGVGSWWLRTFAEQDIRDMYTFR